MATDSRDRALYIISVAAELAGVHPQTLRIYERKGLIEPSRTEGRSRRYSDRDIALLQRIQELTNEGVSLVGVRKVLELEAELDDARGADRGAARRDRAGARRDPTRGRRRPAARTGATSCQCRVRSVAGARAALTAVGDEHLRAGDGRVEHPVELPVRTEYFVIAQAETPVDTCAAAREARPRSTSDARGGRSRRCDAPASRRAGGRTSPTLTEARRHAAWRSGVRQARCSGVHRSLVGHPGEDSTRTAALRTPVGTCQRVEAVLTRRSPAGSECGHQSKTA